MNAPARAGLGAILGAFATAGILMLAAPRPGPATAAAPAAEPSDPVPSDADLAALATRVAEAEARAARSDPPAVTPGALAGPAAAYVAALRAPGTGDRSAAALSHLLRRAWFELQLSDEETLIHPLRDRLIPDVLAAWDLPLTEEQRPALEALLAWEDEAWKVRKEVRGKETPVQRSAAALELAVRMDDWLSKILTPAQLAALSTPSPGRTPRDRRPLLGARRAPAGPSFDARQDNAEIALAGLWGARLGSVPGLTEAAANYVRRLRDLGPVAVDEYETVPLGWGARRAAAAADVQRAWQEAAPGESGVRRWVGEEIWEEE